MRERRVSDAPTVDRDAPSSVDAARPLRHRRLLVIEAGGELITRELGEAQSVTIGRSEWADITVIDPSLSREHARFTNSGRSVCVEDLGSRNGVTFDGRRVRRLSLELGQRVTLGRTLVTLHLLGASMETRWGTWAYPELLQAATEELQRARSFGRTTAALWLRAARAGQVGVQVALQAVREQLRAIDRVASYGDDALVVLMPESDVDATLQCAEALVKPKAGRGRLVAGVAVGPAAASTGEGLLLAAQRACAKASHAAPIQVHESPAQRPARPTDNLVIQSPAMRAIDETVRRVAPGRVSMLVLGETGAGKEWVARSLHDASGRNGPLKVVNCAALPAALLESLLFGHERGAFTGAEQAKEGVFAEAHRGTLFLDEIGELPLAAQATMLRVLETRRVTPVGGSREREVDVRLVAATHRDLQSMAADGTFRLDLLHRINTIVVAVPPLRERADEIVPLAERFAAEAARDWNLAPPRLAPGFVYGLQRYGWPGNVRELRNVVERAVALTQGKALDANSLPAHMLDPGDLSALVASPNDTEEVLPAGGIDLKEVLRARELELVGAALARAEGDRRQAAALLRLSQRTFDRRAAELRDQS